MKAKLNRRRARKVPIVPPSRRVPADADIITIDPGVRNPAVAYFSAGRLVRAARVLVDDAWTHLWIGQRALHIATRAVEWLGGVHSVAPRDPMLYIVFENPKVRRETQSGGVDANDLTKIAAVANQIVGMYAARYPDMITVLSPFPEDVWATTKKCTSGDPRQSVRGSRVWDRLDETERAGLELTHDAFDAAGIGLWALGRFERHRVFPGAT